MARQKIEMRAVADLRPHPLNKELYGSPTANSAYEVIKDNMRRNGYDERHPLLVTEDGRILWGTTRWAAAKVVKITELPCQVYVPEGPETAEIEFEQQLITGNVYRVKTQLIIAREQRKLLEVESELARRRKGEGTDGGPSRAADRVGQTFKVSGKTVGRFIKILEAIEAAEEQGDRKLAQKLTECLERKETTKALDLINGEGKKAPRTPKAAEVPRTLLDHSSRAHSEWFEACSKAQVRGDLKSLYSTLDAMLQATIAAEKRVKGDTVPPGVDRHEWVFDDIYKDRERLRKILGGPEQEVLRQMDAEIKALSDSNRRAEEEE